MRVVAATIILAVLGVVAVFSIQNQQVITVSFAGYAWRGPVWVPAATAAVAMFVASIFYGALSGMSWRLRYRRLSKTAHEYRAAVQRLQGVNQELREELDHLHMTSGDTMPAMER